ncbi:MAG: TraR/DksA family transcriptional regulator, partial [Nitrospina sp.]|nr:TraR/DksA family transcriptional regulator [Nitrospina sp.]
PAVKKKAVKKAVAKKPAVKKKAVKKAVAKKPAVKKKAVKKAIAKKPAVKKKAVKKAIAKKPAVKKKAVKKTTGKVKATSAKIAPTNKIAKKPKQVKVSPTKKGKAQLEPAVQKIRDRLITNRIELLGLIQASQSVERDVGDLTFSNEIDLASSLEGREMLFQLTSRDRNELKLIEEALFRINSGSYGECESCEKKISLKRLQIMPLTALCIECQEAAENL